MAHWPARRENEDEVRGLEEGKGGLAAECDFSPPVVAVSAGDVETCCSHSGESGYYTSCL